MDENEVIKISEAMIKYGGSFVESLGKALLQADHINRWKIKNAFPEYWKQYKEMAEKSEVKDGQENKKEKN